MSPSRIPRPGGIGSPTITTSPLSQSTTTARPALGTLVHTSKNPFAQLHNNNARNVSPQNHGSPTPSNGSGMGNLSVSSGTGAGVGKGGTTRRRIKPPSPDLNDNESNSNPNIGGGGGVQRRPVPSDLPKARIPSGPGQGQRSIFRQPSTPSLVSSSNNNKSPVPQGRPRALSSTSVSRPVIVHRNTNSPVPTSVEGTGIRSLPSQKILFESSFLESRQPAVPPHIRIRLKLIHQLGCVLGIDAVGISNKIDIPGLLARVDQAYDRERDRSTNGPSINGGQNVNTVEVALKSNAVGKDGLSGGNNQTKGVFGMFKRLGGNTRKSDEGLSGGNSPTIPQEGPAFGVPLSEAPPGSWCTSLIGGQKHELPLVVFTIVEEIYRRGMSQPGIFRLAGDGVRISHLTKVFNLPPLYGDSLPINQEPIHNLTGLVKRYVRDLPEPILDDSLFPAFLAFCVGNDDDEKSESNTHKDKSENAETAESNTNSLDDKDKSDDNTSSSTLENDLMKLPLESRITAAQILLKLLPPLQFSLFIYLLAFLGQLPLFPDNRLNIESISIIFGPAMCAARGRGISGLGPTVSSSTATTSSNNGSGFNTTTRKTGLTGNGNSNAFDPDSVSDLVSKSQNVLSWLLRNWSGISEKVLEDDESLTSSPSFQHGFADHNHNHEDNTQREKEKEKRLKKEKPIIDPRLLSPIDLRGSNDGMRARKPDSSSSIKTSPNENQDSLNAPPIFIPSSIQNKSSVEPTSPISPIIQTPHTHIQMGLRKSSSSHTLETSHSSSALKSSPSSSSGIGIGMKSSPSSGGLFARALSSMSISSQAQGNDSSAGLGKGPKRSASFTSLSSLVKKVGKDHSKHPPLPTRSLSDDRDNAHSSVNPQITTVLGSLHDLLVSKDKQIERDARELALLRHTLLEMDEKLQKATLASPLPGPIGLNGCTCPIHPNATTAGLSSTTVNISGNEGVTPEITITSTPSSSSIIPATTTAEYNKLNKEINDLQGQLKTALAASETSRLNSRKHAERILILEAKNSRIESEKRLEISKLQVALALEQARSVGLIEERDLARERLEKVKTTLFSVA